MPAMALYPISDLRIRVEVRDRLRNAPGLDASDIEVRVDHCEVHLGGVVWSDADAARAVAVAAAVDGVKRVRNDLLVQARGGGMGTGFVSP